MTTPHLSALYVHPIKSGRPRPLASATFDRFGICGDREYLVVRPDGRFVTGRTHRQLTAVDVVPGPEGLRLRHPQLETPLELASAAPPSSTQRVEVWGDEVEAHDVGEPAARWFSELLEEPVRLVRRAQEQRRPVDPDYCDHEDVDAGFTDGFPLLVVNQASLAALNEAIAAAGADPVGLERFRPNLVVEGFEPWAEDGWRALRIGEALFEAPKPCTRCVLTTVDPERPDLRNREPLATLRRLRPALTFGVNLVHRSLNATLRVGDPVEILPGPTVA